MPTTQRYVGVVSRCPPSSCLRRFRHLPAFTLAELLVVGVMIVLVMLVSLPVLTGWLERRQPHQTARCGSNVDSIVMAMIEYSTENRQRFPAGAVTVGETESDLSWHNLLGESGLIDTTPPEGRILNKYINDNYWVAKCPRDAGDGTVRGPETAWELCGSSYLWWDRTADQVQNGQLVGRNGVWAVEGHSEEEIEEPSKKCLIADLVILTDRTATDQRSWWHNDEEPLEVSIGYADGHADNVQRKTGVGPGEPAEYEEATVIDAAKRDSWIATRYY